MTREQWLAEFVIVLRQARTRAGLSEQQLTVDLGRGRSSMVGLWERGIQVPGLDDLFDLAAVLGVDPAELLPAVPGRAESEAAELRRLIDEIRRLLATVRP
jgi:transcriptional regulator with XRE-family HTH domain